MKLFIEKLRGKGVLGPITGGGTHQSVCYEIDCRLHDFQAQAYATLVWPIPLPSDDALNALVGNRVWKDLSCWGEGFSNFRRLPEHERPPDQIAYCGVAGEFEVVGRIVGYEYSTVFFESQDMSLSLDPFDFPPFAIDEIGTYVSFRISRLTFMVSHAKWEEEWGPPSSLA